MIAAFILSSSPGERFIKGIAKDKLEKTLELSVAIDKLETNLFTRLQVHNLVITQRHDSTSPSLLSVENIHIGYSLPHLLFGDIELNKILINNASINLHRDSLGKFNVHLLDSIMETSSEIPTDQSADASLEFLIRLLAVENFSLAFIDDSLGLIANITNLNTRLESLSTNKCNYTLTIENIKTTYNNMSFDVIQTASEGAWSGDKILSDKLSLRIDSLAFAASGEIPLDSTARYKLTASIAGNPNSLFEKLGAVYDLPPIHFAGQLDAGLNMTGLQQSPRIGINATIPALTIDRAQSAGGYLSAQWCNDSLFIDTFALRVFGGEITANGNAFIDSIPSADLRLGLKKISIPEIWQTIYAEETPNRGFINADLKIAGAGYEPESWKINSNFSATRLKYEDISLPDLKGNMDFTDGVASLHVIEGDNLKINMSGRVRDDKISGRFTTDISDMVPIAALFNIPDIDGAAFIAGAFSGTTDLPLVEVSVFLSRMHYQNIPLDTLESQIEYKNDSVYIKMAKFAGRLEATDDVRPLFEIDSLFTAFDYSGSLTGTIDNPEGVLDIHFLKSGYGEYFLDSADLHINVNGQDSVLHRGAIFKGSLSSTLEGSLDLVAMQGKLKSEIFDIIMASVPDQDSVAAENRLEKTEVASAGIIRLNYNLSDTTDIAIKTEISNLHLGIAKHFVVDTFGIKGITNGEIALSGDLFDPNFSLDARLSDVGTDRITLDTILVKASFNKGELDIDQLDIFRYEQSLIGIATLHLEKDSTGYLLPDNGRIAGRMSMNNFEIGTLAPLLTNVHEISGITSVELSWDGTIRDPMVSGQFSIDDGYLLTSSDNYPIENVAMQIMIDDSLLTIDRATAKIMDNNYSLTGYAITPDYERVKLDLNLSVDGLEAGHIVGEVSSDFMDLMIRTDSFDLAMLHPFLTDIKEIAGILTTDVNIRGSFEDPEIDGRLNIIGLRVWSELMPIPFDKGIATVRFNRDKVFLDTLSLQMNKGILTAGGFLSHDLGEITDINMRLTADSIHVSRPKEYIVRLSKARLSYKKVVDYYLLDGDIEFGESRLTANVGAQNILPWARSVEKTRTELPPILEQTRLNVRIRESNNLWIDNNLARLRIRTELGIIGSPGLPNFSGRVNVEEGYILYLDRKFQVKKGDIYFVDPNRFNPEIAFNAVANVKSYQATEVTPYDITFSAQGLLDELKVELISDPPLDKGDIVALLTLGATRSQLAGKESGMKGAISERAQALSSQRISGFISSKVGTVFGLDEVSVEGNLFSRNASAGPQLLASKRISGRIKLTYKQTVGKSNDQSIRLDYQLSKRFFLEGQTDRIGRSALDLKYKLGFR